MHKVLRQLISVAAGGVLVAAALIGMRVFAQDDATPASSRVVGQISATDATTFQQITYQGVLFDSTGQTKPDGSYPMTFTIWDSASGGSALWGEVQSVVVANGYFSVRLGSVYPLGANLFMLTNGQSQQRWLGVQVSTDPEMTPRQQFTRVPYAYGADRATTAYSAYKADNLTSLVGYGAVDANATTQSGAGFSVRVGNFGNVNPTYQIDIGQNYDWRRFTTTVTPVLRSDCPNPVMAMTGSLDNRLLVNFLRPDGSVVRCSFSFMVIANP